MTAFAAFLLCLGGGWVFPWWWPALVGFGLGIWRPSGTRAFLFPALGAGAAWMAAAGWIQIQNQGLLADKVATLFHLPGGWWLVAAAALVGGATAGIGALAGTRCRETGFRTRRSRT